MITTNLFVIANVKQLRTDGSFRILLPFFWTIWGVGVQNSAIFNCFPNPVEFGTILVGPRNFGGGGLTPPPVMPLTSSIHLKRGLPFLLPTNSLPSIPGINIVPTFQVAIIKSISLFLPSTFSSHSEAECSVSEEIILTVWGCSPTPNPQPGVPGYPLLSGSSPLTPLELKTLPVAYATTSIALGFIRPRKPLHYVKVAIPSGGGGGFLSLPLAKSWRWCL